SAKSLTVTLRTLLVVGNVSSLVYAGKCGYPADGDSVGGDFKGKLKLQLRRERLGVLVIDNVEIGNEAENFLLLLDLDLLGSNLLGGISHIDRGQRRWDL